MLNVPKLTNNYSDIYNEVGNRTRRIFRLFGREGERKRLDVLHEFSTGFCRTSLELIVVLVKLAGRHRIIDRKQGNISGFSLWSGTILAK